VIRPLSIGFSPYPNDTFVFHAMVAGEVVIPGFSVTPWLADLEALHARAFGRDPLAVTKLSVHAFAHVADRYMPLRVGAVVGRGCGPVVVARTGGALRDLVGRRVAIPGRFTTAHLMLRMFGPLMLEVVPMRLEDIVPAVAEGRVDAGVVTHEGCFTYADHGLAEVADLGALWEADTKLPLPLAVVAVRRAPGNPPAEVLESALRASILAARARPDASAAYVRMHAQEMDREACRRRIALYVNDYSLELGPEGEAAVAEMLARGASVGILPRAAWPS